MGLSLRLRALAAGAVALLLLAPAAPARAADPIVNTEPPTVVGSAVFRERLQSTPGAWTPDGLTLSYQWLRDGAPIPGATTATYRVALADIGTRLSLVVTASDGTGASLAVATDETAQVDRARLELVTPPAIEGVPRYQHRLRAASLGEWSRRLTAVKTRWLRAGHRVRGATKQRYLLGVPDVGRRIRLQVVATRPGYYPARVRSAPTRRIGYRVRARRTVTYRIETRGRITASLATFRRQVQQTYADPRGWRNGGVRFRQVRSGGDFSVVLAEAGWVPRFSSGCSAQWSCRVGRYVIINQMRWRHATPSWNRAGKSRRGYRHMVVNHETGHWLGHGHLSCPGPGRLAPVMMQQSKGLAGCKHNPWPLRSELWWRKAPDDLPRRAVTD